MKSKVNLLDAFFEAYIRLVRARADCINLKEANEKVLRSIKIVLFCSDVKEVNVSPSAML